MNIILAHIKKISNNKSIVNGAIFSVFSFVNRGFSFLLLLILAKYMPPAQYGYLSLFSTISMVVGYFMAMSTEGYFGISYFREDNQKLKETFSCIISTSVIMLCFFCVCLALGGSFIPKLVCIPQNMLYLSLVLCFFTVFSNILLDYFRIQEKVKMYGIFSSFNALLNFVLSIIFVKTLMLGWEGRVWAQTICFTFFGIISIMFFWKHGFVIKPSLSHWRVILLWGIPLIPHLAATFVRQGCDRYIINYSHSITDVGLFGFAMNLADIIIMVGMGFNQSNSVDIYKVLGNKELSNTNKISKISYQKKMIFKLYSAISIVIIIFAYNTIPFILPKYAPAMNYFIILGIYGFINCLYFLYTNFLFFYKQTRKIMYITFGSSVLHLTMSLILTPYSLYYTCILYCIIQALVFVLIRYYANKELYKNLNI